MTRKGRTMTRTMLRITPEDESKYFAFSEKSFSYMWNHSWCFYEVTRNLKVMRASEQSFRITITEL